MTTMEESSLQPKLPLEIIEEILSRSPADSVHRFRCVCKSWNSLITDPRFVKRHCGISNGLTHHRIFINRNSQEMILRSYSVDSILAERSAHIGESIRFPLRREIRIFGLVGSCNGLVCFFVGDGSGDEIYICNPCTRESRKLPLSFSTSVVRNIFGFGYDQNTNDYKLIRMDMKFPRRGKITVDIFSFATCSTRRIQDFPYEGRINEDGSPYGVLVDSYVHWIARPSALHRIIVVALDLATETYREIPPPEFSDGPNPRCQMKLDALEGSLLLLCNYRRSHHDVLMMKEYGIRQSWTRLLRVPCSEVPTPNIRFPKLMSVSEDGETILMIRQLSLVMCSTKEDQFFIVPNPDFFDMNDDGYQLRARLDFNTIPSLVSPGTLIMGG